ncbi:MAG: 50S ribosomal protein L29 [Planctomycetota bacterium]|nr:50S ribosomal protein L29 [Planctomycetota bacterium]
METKDIRKLNDEQLTAEVKAAQRRLFDLRTQQVVGEKVTDHSQFGKLRLDVARMKTEETSRRRTTK